jgi:arylformamidase
MNDISVAVRVGLAVWDDEVMVESEALSTVAGEGSAVSRLVMSSHTGTHVDAPAHCIEGGAGVDEMPLDAMIGRCVVRRFDERFEISADQLEGAGIPEGTTRLLLATPSAELWDLPGFQIN